MSARIEVPRYAQGSCGVTHVDEGMLRFFRGVGCHSMLDVGCGPGGQVEAARKLGYRAIGVDVDPTLYRRPGVALYDLCVEPLVLPEPADLVWSVECAEHIPPSCVERYVDALTTNARRFICMTASQIPAELHVSVHPPEWWIERVTSRKGWLHLRTSDVIIQQHSTMRREFLATTGMIFAYV